MNKRFKTIGTKLGLLDPEYTAEEVSMMSRYNTSKTTFQEVVDKEVEDINSKIKLTLQTSSDLLYFKTVLPYQRPLYTAIKKIFEERGFKVFFANSNQLPELGDTEILFISWDVTTEEEKKLKKES